jgi:predicted phage terminase large subunit-like protein
MDIRPQPGPQTAFLSSPADIVVYGGSSGGGKTFGLLLEAARNINNPNYGGVIFRREQTMITNEGGLRDTALNLYPYLGAEYRSQPHPHFIFPTGAKISFRHLNQESDVLGWQGSQIPFIGYDELNHFSQFQWIYLFSRLRSTSGVRPYIRATTNPDADSWVADMLEWWIDQDSNSPSYGLPIQERSGVIRYFVRINNELMWADSPEELVSRHNCDYLDAKSFTFIPSRITDNPILMQKDPAYLSNLKALTRVERARLLDGNWKVRPQAGDYFPRDAVTIIDWMPTDVVKWIRSWDLAATEEGEGRDPDWTACGLLGRRSNGKIVVADVIRVRRKAAVVESLVKTVAMRDGEDVWIQLPQDPGQSGKSQKESYVSALYHFTVLSRTITKNKVAVASGGADSPAALWQRGQVELVRGPWNDAFLEEMDAFPTKGVHDDQVDFFSNGVRALPGHSKPDYSQSGLSGTYRPIRQRVKHR